MVLLNTRTRSSKRISKYTLVAVTCLRLLWSCRSGAHRFVSCHRFPCASQIAFLMKLLRIYLPSQSAHRVVMFVRAICEAVWTLNFLDIPMPVHVAALKKRMVDTILMSNHIYLVFDKS